MGAACRSRRNGSDRMEVLVRTPWQHRRLARRAQHGELLDHPVDGRAGVCYPHWTGAGHRVMNHDQSRKAWERRANAGRAGFYGGCRDRFLNVFLQDPTLMKLIGSEIHFNALPAKLLETTRSSLRAVEAEKKRKNVIGACIIPR